MKFKFLLGILAITFAKHDDLDYGGNFAAVATVVMKFYSSYTIKKNLYPINNATDVCCNIFKKWISENCVTPEMRFITNYKTINSYSKK